MFEKVRHEISDYAIEVWNYKYPCGNGGWIHYYLSSSSQIDDIIKLLHLKIKPHQVN